MADVCIRVVPWRRCLKYRKGSSCQTCSPSTWSRIRCLAPALRWSRRYPSIERHYQSARVSQRRRNGRTNLVPSVRWMNTLRGPVRILMAAASMKAGAAGSGTSDQLIGRAPRAGHREVRPVTVSAGGSSEAPVARRGSHRLGPRHVSLCSAKLPSIVDRFSR